MNVEAEILACEREWLLALERHDFGSLADILAEDFSLTSWASEGEIVTKDQYLRDARHVTISSAAIDNCSLQIYEHTAVLKCRLHWNAEFQGRTWCSEFLITDVWANVHGRWRAVARHASTPLKKEALVI